jgi:hypothetical protein
LYQKDKIFNPEKEKYKTKMEQNKYIIRNSVVLGTPFCSYTFVLLFAVVAGCRKALFTQIINLNIN